MADKDDSTSRSDLSDQAMLRQIAIQLRAWAVQSRKGGSTEHVGPMRRLADRIDDRVGGVWLHTKAAWNLNDDMTVCLSEDGAEIASHDSERQYKRGDVFTCSGHRMFSLFGGDRNPIRFIGMNTEIEVSL